MGRVYQRYTKKVIDCIATYVEELAPKQCLLRCKVFDSSTSQHPST